MPRLSALVPPPLRPFAKKLRDFLRPAEHVSLDIVLPATDCRAALTPVPGQVLIQRASTYPVQVRASNLGSAVWSSTGQHPIHLTTRWLSSRKEAIDFPIVRYALPRAVRPSDEVEFPITLAAPDFLGHFLVEVDLEQQGGPAFRDCGSRSPWIEAQVTGRDSDDIDYHAVYATADLTRDYWTVVGPSTKDEFEKLGHVKLSQLQQLGLTPDSRILDVGCGTGQLAIPLEGYLSDRGAYVGTDIGSEAITFCRERFKRPNFRFLQNEMTTLPLANETFDFITYFSVFTHTFPDETALLLAESNRLLAPGGIILGDVFTSPMVERCSGNRGAMELNREHFLRLVELAGLKAEVIDSWPWQKYGRREVMKYTRR